MTAKVQTCQWVDHLSRTGWW